MNSLNKTRFRVAFESRENYRVLDVDQKLWPAKMTGKLRDESTSYPIVGDWVEGIIQPGNWILIERILDRKSAIIRNTSGGAQNLAANVDILFIVTSANQDLNLNRLDRYLALVAQADILPVILINKIELAENPGDLLDQVAAQYPDVNIHGISALESLNIECLSRYAQPGVTVAFVGSSGVGKSSLTNALLKTQTMDVQEIREEDDRGKHTTTARHLHMTAEGAFVIDTPGIRGVGLTETSDLSGIFAEVEALIPQCKFTDCQHETEPGCAIQRALHEGRLEPERWENYLKLQKEIEFEQRKASKALQAVERKKWAKISQNQKQHYKMRR